MEARFLLYESKAIIPGVFDLTHTRNTGVAFGLFANSDSPWVPYILMLTAATALIAILVYSLRHPVDNWKLQLGLMLVLGGAAGNLYDRINYGYVIDFLDVFYGTYHWPTFNVADSCDHDWHRVFAVGSSAQALGRGSEDRRCQGSQIIWKSR